MSAEPAPPPWNSDGEWYVLHTKSRQEKALADSLAAMRVSHYLPLSVETRYYGKRKMSVELPLFPGYLFVRGTLDQAYEADRTGRVAQIIRVPDQNRMEWELRNLHQALSARVPLAPAPFIKEGVRVEVRSGPFRGLQGIVESRGVAGRFLLQVHILGRAVSLEIEHSLLDVVDRHR